MLNLPVQSFNKKDLPEIFKKMIDKYIEKPQIIFICSRGNYGYGTFR